jgi:hypothetical protein
MCLPFGLVLPCARGQQAISNVPGAASSAPQAASSESAAGTITGTITDTAGALVSGAHVTLSVANDAADRKTDSGDDGRFAFQNVMSGAFSVRVALQGFDPAKASGELRPGETEELRPIGLKLSIISSEVEVVPPEVLAQQQLHAEEQQRLIGAFPNFFVAYDWDAQPLSTRQKFSLAWKNTSDPGNLVLVAGLSGIQQAENAFPGYGHGAAGYGRRYGANLGNLVSGTYLGGAILPTIFHQDPRYFYKGTGTIRSRLIYALESAVICRGDDGRRQPAIASLLGDFSAGAISNLYYAPSDRQGAVLTIENGLLGIAGDALNGVFQEFFSHMLTPKAGKLALPQQP